MGVGFGFFATRLSAAAGLSLRGTIKNAELFCAVEVTSLFAVQLRWRKGRGWGGRLGDGVIWGGVGENKGGCFGLELG
ncbi:MAG: hypothetical protein V8R91_06015 [Butyricimonas faecihominis]